MFSERFGIAVEPGWDGFPDTLRVLAAAARGGGDPVWGPQLFFDSDGALVGNGGWKGPPDKGVAEIEYAVSPSRQRRGIASDVVGQLVEQARRAGLTMVRAHTLAEENASTRVLSRFGFVRTGEIREPDEGRVWRWELDLRKPLIREGRGTDWERLREIEKAADQLFLEVGIGPFNTDVEEDHFDSAAVVLVAGEPPAGFACVDILDGAAHIWQLSVHPSAGRRGIGTALIGAVADWARSNGYPAITLTTFRDVAWNAPFYSRLGFEVLDELPRGLQAIREHEGALGDDDFGPRVAMGMNLS